MHYGRGSSPIIWLCNCISTEFAPIAMTSNSLQQRSQDTGASSALGRICSNAVANHFRQGGNGTTQRAETVISSTA
eukprot:6209658-Pleurochrysis_carterae.AAC.1